MEERLGILAGGLAQEQELIDRSMAERAERMRWWEEMVSRNTAATSSKNLAAYQSVARSMAALLGGSIKDQAAIMVPFEIAESAQDFAKFLGSGDPTALAASLQHALAAKQYAAVAKTGVGGGGGGGGGGGHGGGGGGKREEAAPVPERKATRVIVNVGRGVGVIDTYEFARGLIGAINENLSDDVVLEVAS
jgi:hypothetical protein